MGGLLGPFGGQFVRLGDTLINKVTDEILAIAERRVQHAW